MGYPFHYTGHFISFSNSGLSNSELLKDSELFKSIDLKQNIYQYENSFLGLPVRVKVRKEAVADNVKLWYRLYFFEINMVTIIGLALTIFFAWTQNFSVAWFSAVITFLWYAMALIVNGLRVHRDLPKAFGITEQQSINKRWQLQQQWTQDPTLCSACGEPINEYSDVCVGCGIHIKKLKNKKPSATSSSAGDVDINFEVK